MLSSIFFKPLKSKMFRLVLARNCTDTGNMVNHFAHRLEHLEMLYPTAGDHFMGTLKVPPGQRPLDALLGAEPGIWLLASPTLDGGLLGRVTQSGRREIMFSDRAQQQQAT